MLIGKLLLGIYCALLLIIVVRQFSMVYYPNLPSRELTADPKDVGLAFENVQIATEDNQQLHGWYIPAQKNSDVLLFFHGKRKHCPLALVRPLLPFLSVLLSRFEKAVYFCF